MYSGFTFTRIEKFKPLICDLIKYYYNECGYSTGGPHLHYILDDGNIDRDCWESGKNDCFANNDHLGFLICEVMLLFSDEEIEAMYEKGWEPNPSS
jgi:hypothetical protein